MLSGITLSAKEDRAFKLLRVYVENGKSHKTLLRPSIYMTPSILRDLNPSSFDPRVVSIGPLHREDNKLKAFEGHKASYLSNLMLRIREYSQEDIILKLCVQKVSASMEQIKACYGLVTLEKFSDAEIVNMMIVDACFILEFLVLHRESKVGHNIEGILLYQNILYDLVLLENQIPFFILEEIFQCTLLKCYSNDSLLELIYPFLNDLNIFKTEYTMNKLSFNEPHHILSLLHLCYQPPVNIIKGRLADDPTTFHSVSDLVRAGVSFKPNKGPTWLMGMEVKLNRFRCFFWFWSKPIFTIPVLKVDDNTDLILRNLIAYEQSGSDDTYVTSYAFALNTLVDSQADVAIMVDSKVLVNYLGSEEEVATFINSICKDVVLRDFFYKIEWEKLSRYYEGYWPKNMAKLKRNYFGSPWSMIALVAGIILFTLTVIQTIFTVNPPS